MKKSIHHLKTFSKYLIVGATVTIIDLGFLYIFVEFTSLKVVPAAIASFFIANITSFILNKIWTFKIQTKNYKKLYVKFLSVSLVGVGLTALFMQIFVSIGIWYMLGKIITSCIVVIWNFLGNNFWTFKINGDETNRHSK